MQVLVVLAILWFYSSPRSRQEEQSTTSEQAEGHDHGDHQ